MINTIGGKRVLLVDDEVAVRNLYQLSLEKAGMIVFTAAGVSEALSLAHSLTFDAAVVDLHLADGDGLALIQQMVKQNGNLKFFAMSGYPYTEEQTRALADAGIEFHSKFQPLAELIAKLEK